MTKLKHVALVLALCQFFGFVATAQTHFTFTNNTGNNATVGIPLSANPKIGDTPLAVGDEIGAFDTTGLCVGAVVWDGVNALALTVWGDNDQTPAVDGIHAGEVIKYRVWRQATNTEFSNATVTYSTDPSGLGKYSANGVYVISSLSIVAGSATKYLVTSSSYGPVAGTGVTITAQLADANGLPVKTAGKTVTWSNTGTGGSFGSPTSTTDANGVATVTFTTGTTAGTVYTVTGTDNTSLTGTSSNITTIPGPATKYLVTSSSYGPVAGTNVTITAQLSDANGNAVATSGKTVTWSKTGTGGSFGSPTSTTNASGIATVTFTTGTTAGTAYTVTATDNTSLTGTSSNITTVPGPATKYLVTSSSYGPVAGTNVTITAQLSDANNNAVATSGKTVTWSKTGSGGSFGSLTSTTNASGIATVVFTTGTVAGIVYAITGTDNTSLAGTAPNITTVPGPATKYIVGANRYNPAAGDTVGIVAQLVDANNNPVSTSGKTVTWSKTGTGGSIGSSTSNTDANGAATVTFTTGTVAGTAYTVTGTDNTSLTGTTPTITTVAGAATKYIVTSSSSTPVAGRPVTITAQLADANNNPVPTSGKTVTWSSTNGGSFGAPTSPTNGSGVATVSFTTSNTVGTVHTVTATDNTSLTGTSGNITTQMYFTFTANTGNNATVGIPLAAGPTILGSALVAGDEIGAYNTTGLCVGAVVWDGVGNAALTVWGDNDQTVPVDGIKAGDTLKFRVWRQSTNTEYPNFLVTYTTDPTGHGTYVANGVYVVGSMTPVGTIPTKYIVTSSGYSPIAGANVTIRAQLSDAGNLPVTKAGQVVTWSSTNGGSFASPTSTTDANGQATVVFTTSPVAGTVHAVTGTDNTSLVGTSPNITTVPGPATKYVVGANRYNPVAGDTVGIRAQLTDANNNPIATAGLTVTWSKTGTGGSFASPTSTTDANGVATVVFTTSTIAGTVYTITGTDPTPFTGTTPNITTIPGPATKYLVTSSSYGPIAGANVTITAQLSDVNNNAVPTSGKTVTWSKTGTGGSFASPTSTTNASGVATVVFTTSTLAGTVYAITGTDNTSLAGTTANITTSVGPAAKYIVGANRYNPIAGDTVGVVAQLTDANNNAVATAGKTVTWSKSGVRGSFSSPTSTTNASGIAAVVFTTDTVAGIATTVTGADATPLTGTSPTITTVPGPATKYLVTSSNNSPIGGTAVTITAQLADVNNNAVPTSGKTVTWSSTNGGSFGTPTSTTNASGVATVIFTTSNVVGTTHTVTATDNTSLTGTTDIATVAGPPTKYVVTSSSYSPIAGSGVTITAQLADVGGNPIKTAGKTVTWSKTGTSGSFASPSSTTDANGIATVVFTTWTVAGTVYTVTGTDNNSLTGTTSNITTVAGPEAKYIVGANRYNPVAGDTVGIVARLVDANNNAVATAGKTVTWSKTGTGGSFGLPTTTTNASGVATVFFNTSTTSGIVYTVTGTDNTSLTGTSPNITTNAGPATKYVVTSSNYNPVAGSSVTITAQLADANNNPVTTANKSVTWSKTGAGGTFSSGVSTTDGSGAATVLFTTGTVAGTVHTVTGTDNTSLTGTTTNITTVVGLPAKYIVGASRYSPIAGDTVGVVARLVDVNNNAVATAGKTVTWTKTGTGGSFGSPTSTTDANGIATVLFTTGTVAGTVYAIIATDNTPVTGTSPNITTVAGPATKYVVTASNNSPIGGTPVVINAQLADVNNNPVFTSGKTVTWTSTNGGTFGSPTSTTNVNGVASVTFTTVSIVGTTHTVTATDNTSLTGTSASITTVAGPPTKYIVTVSRTLPAAGDTVTVWAQLSDVGNNPIRTPGRSVSWSKTGTGGSFAGASSTTDGNGIASVIFTVGTVAGTAYTVTATDFASLTGTTAQFTTVAGPPSQYVVRASRYNPAAGDTVTIYAQLSDAYKNPTMDPPPSSYKVGDPMVARLIAGRVITWGTSGSGGSFSSPTSLVDATGLAFVVFTTGTVPGTVYTFTATDNRSMVGTSPAVVSPPSPPVLVSPRDADYVTSLPTYVWMSSFGATSYKLQVSLVSDFAQITIERTTTDTSLTVGGLTIGSTYFWRVQATNAGGSNPSLSRGFTVTGTVVVPPPVPVAPADTATLVSVNPTFEWNASTYAVSYRLQVATDASFTTPIIDDSTITGTSKQAGPLLNNTTYFWRVNAKGSSGVSAFSATRKFKTTPLVPLAPVLVSPADTSRTAILTQTLIWRAAAGAKSYWLEVSVSSSFTTTFFSDSTLTDTTKQIGPLAKDTTYYWRVSAKNEAGMGPFSVIRSFKTTPSVPPAPVLVSPADTAKAIPVSPTLVWRSASGAKTYWLQLGIDSSFTPALFSDSTLVDTTKQVGPLGKDTTYFWRVSAKNDGGRSPFSAARSFKTIPALAPPPILVSPADTARAIPLSPTLVWRQSVGAKKYWLQVANDSSFAVTVFSDSTLSDTTKQIGPLKNDTTYFWRVCGKNDAGNGLFSAVRGFKTIPLIPVVPVLVSPLDGATRMPLSVSLVWRASSRAKNYWLEVSKSSSFGVRMISDSSLTDTTRQVGPLGNDTTYYWRVSAKNDGGMSASSEVRSFRTVPVAVLTPSLVSPNDGATGVSINPSLTWRSPAGAKTYWLQLSRSAAFAATVLSDSTITDTTRQVGPLNNDSTYFWRVAAKDGGGFSPFTSAWSFRTIQAIPAAPTLVTPASGATGIATGPRLTWNASPGASSYALQVSTSATFASTVVDQSGITTTSQTISGLASNTLYYWRVNATNTVGTSAWSTPFSFTTVGAAPAAPTLSSPSNDALRQPTSPQLTWSAVTGAATYQVQVATNGTFASPVIVVDQSGITGTSYTAGLPNNTLYYWRVNATNAAGTSPWSAIWHFTVGTVVSVERFDSDIPTQYRLSQNYPNPFNPSTTIQFSLPKSGSVSLRIYNALGEIVTTLLNEDLPVGNYRIRWNAAQVASGMYFYQLQAGEFQETKRLILLK